MYRLITDEELERLGANVNDYEMLIAFWTDSYVEEIVDTTSMSEEERVDFVGRVADEIAGEDFQYACEGMSDAIDKVYCEHIHGDEEEEEEV
jgi:hypothetical protein